MNKLLAGIIICIALLLYGCASNQSQNNTLPSGSPNPYAGTYTGTETFERGIFPLTIIIKKNGKVRIIDVDNLSAQGVLEDNNFTVKRYGSSPMVFEGSITDSTISGITYGNRFLGDGTFEVTLEQ